MVTDDLAVPFSIRRRRSPAEQRTRIRIPQLHQSGVLRHVVQAAVDVRAGTGSDIVAVQIDLQAVGHAIGDEAAIVPGLVKIMVLRCAVEGRRPDLGGKGHRVRARFLAGQGLLQPYLVIDPSGTARLVEQGQVLQRRLGVGAGLSPARGEPDPHAGNRQPFLEAQAAVEGVDHKRAGLGRGPDPRNTCGGALPVGDEDLSV